ncbi:MAG: carbohydrate ABC transporter permease [Chthonomonadales bacterium]|nr:carbohydrate ABC transporter permease [Chthonomonadales bacterium]
MGGRPRRAMRRLLLYAAMVAAAAFFVAPVFWMVSISLQPENEVFSKAPHWLPREPTLRNYRDLFARAEEAPVARWFANSVIVAGGGTLTYLLIASMAAYAFSRLRFPGREPLFVLVLATLIIPGQVTIIPVFLVLQRLGWFNTYLALIVPGLSGAFGVFLLRQFFLTIPRDLEEAAMLDGCGPAGIYARIILPLAKPALATLAIFSFLGGWNDFLLPLIATNEVEMRTLPVGLTLFLGRYDMQYGMVMAVATVASLPVVLIFLAFQRHIVRGVVLSGIKG